MDEERTGATPENRLAWIGMVDWVRALPALEIGRVIPGPNVRYDEWWQFATYLWWAVGRLDLRWDLDEDGILVWKDPGIGITVLDLGYEVNEFGEYFPGSPR